MFLYDPERLGYLSFYPITAGNFTGPSVHLDQDKHFLSVSGSKSHVLQRYSAAFRTNYDVTNFNTWLKSICCKCSRSLNLLLAGNWCY